MPISPGVDDGQPVHLCVFALSKPCLIAIDFSENRTPMTPPGGSTNVVNQSGHDR